jgi:hypothetical protein
MTKMRNFDFENGSTEANIRIFGQKSCLRRAMVALSRPSRHLRINL